jgi:hypothetical protein
MSIEMILATSFEKFTQINFIERTHNENTH